MPAFDVFLAKEVETERADFYMYEQPLAVMHTNIARVDTRSFVSLHFQLKAGLDAHFRVSLQTPLAPLYS